LSIYTLPFPPVPRQFLDRLEDPAPDRAAIHVALVGELFGPLDYAYRRGAAVLVDQHLGGTEYVGIVAHLV
jgi:hypothetical protein